MEALQGWDITYTDRWERIGSLGCLHVLDRVIDGWRIQVFPTPDIVDFTTPVFEWAADDVIQAVQMAEFHDDIAIRRVKAIPLKDKAIEHSLPDDLMLRATSDNEGHFRVNLFDGEGKPIGTYVGLITDTVSTFVIGEMAFSGMRRISEGYRGKGLSDPMTDIAEKFMGLKAVPQGQNMVPGFLNPPAAIYWRRRASQKQVPGLGGDLSTKVRLKIAERSAARCAFGQLLDTVQNGVRIATALSSDMMICRHEDGTQFAWAVDGRGMPISLSGHTSDEKVLRHNISLHGDIEQAGWNIERIANSELCRVEFKESDDIDEDQEKVVTDFLNLRQKAISSNSTRESSNSETLNNPQRVSSLRM
jgi:hypothetical protein